MSKIYRCGVSWLAAFAVAVSCSQAALAQRINFGGSGQSKHSDKNHDDDHDDDRRDQSNNRSSKSGNSTSQKIQQFFQQGTGGQSDQKRSDAERFRNSNQQQGHRGQQFQNLHGHNHGGHDNHNHGSWHGDKWQGSRKIDNWVQTFGGGKKPFSAQWYHDHPKAWKYDNNKTNIWVVGSVPGVYQWLNWGNVPPQYNVGHNHQQHFDPSHYGEWYPLGVYSLMAGPGDIGTRIVQLAIDHHGHLAGNYYDMISDSNYSISGDVKRQSERVYFSLNKNKHIGFRAHISQLLQPYGTITVQLPGGEQQWQFVRLED
jgi:hypothetical protein